MNRRFFQNTLPALPILNLNRLRHLLDTEASSSANYPSAVLTGILAHTVMYRESLRHLHTPLWVEVYQTLTSEFLQPRLQTLQLTVLDLSSRPDKNPGGNGIALARVGPVQFEAVSVRVFADLLWLSSLRFMACRPSGPLSCSECISTAQSGRCRGGSAVSGNVCGGRS